MQPTVAHCVTNNDMAITFEYLHAKYLYLIYSTTKLFPIEYIYERQPPKLFSF